MTTPHMPETFEKMVADIQSDAYRIMIERQRKYGPRNITRHGLTGVIVRAGDKLARLDRLCDPHYSGATANDESVEDTLLDLMNYALIGLAVHRGYWTPAHCPPLAENADASPVSPAATAFRDRQGDVWRPEEGGAGWRCYLRVHNGYRKATGIGSFAHRPLEKIADEYGPLEPLYE